MIDVKGASSRGERQEEPLRRLPGNHLIGFTKNERQSGRFSLGLSGPRSSAMAREARPLMSNHRRGVPYPRL
jgi:hypothetical protein